MPRSVLIADTMINDVFFINGVVGGRTSLRILEPFTNPVCTAECAEEVDYKVSGSVSIFVNIDTCEILFNLRHLNHRLSS